MSILVLKIIQILSEIKLYLGSLCFIWKPWFLGPYT